MLHSRHLVAKLLIDKELTAFEAHSFVVFDGYGLIILCRSPEIAHLSGIEELETD